MGFRFGATFFHVCFQLSLTTLKAHSTLARRPCGPTFAFSVHSLRSAHMNPPPHTYPMLICDRLCTTRFHSCAVLTSQSR
ncbi:hypothetical protein C8R41DRAFT_831496 [Lentinula lateritia]|uniref:Secreted protein n=1 Tax=Lentinula lateritia TaxID=40482 RepID=A0ABQ8VFQ1_9AGAR|nr:hypothetical protein C8R41DRAFT_831496 [Lentinula lateritia]